MREKGKGRQGWRKEARMEQERIVMGGKDEGPTGSDGGDEREDMEEGTDNRN